MKIEFVYQGVVYFFWIHVPEEARKQLTNHHLLLLSLFGVKVGESFQDLWLFWLKLLKILSYHPLIRAYWVCIGVPLGMNSWVIEHFVHVRHPLLYLNSEHYEESIVQFVPTLLQLTGARVIQFGTVNNKVSLRSSVGPASDKSGRLYAVKPHISDDGVRDDLIRLCNLAGDAGNDDLELLLELFLYGTKFGYTTLSSNYRMQKILHAKAWMGGYDLVVGPIISNAFTAEQKLHTLLKERQRNMGDGEFHKILEGVERIKSYVNGTHEILRRTKPQKYSDSYIKLLIHLKLIKKKEIEGLNMAKG